ncbi:cytochrome P450 [Sphingomonas sp. LaA6.9]|uniref:cytochrome P450 n=1 Tax=Sphingomonas sp. LaA6.9 TaxID=2919914 RepID=UPI001F4F9038|nr:cytochrome P450 [Sphingomonas sp. LaA6.9]MCJ8156086.1 cytochrome P450 [Sphingomonas sp. LaA6.9]
MASQATRDYFTDRSVLLDPYAYFEDIRPKGPVHYDETRDLFFVTGHAESVEILRNSNDFSSVITVNGPLVPIPFEPEGDDVSAQIEAHWAALAGPDLIVSYDGARHSNSRALLNRLFVPSRLKANEEYMQQLGKRMVGELVAKGQCEAIREVGAPYVTLVIADLLGVPADDRNLFMDVLAKGPTAGDIQAGDQGQDISSLIFMGQYFFQYLSERRTNPRDDVMSELATATFPDGSTPDLTEVVKLAVFLFAAGQDTSAKLLGNSLRTIAETPELQARLRSDRSMIAPFVEEMLRLEGSTKATFRLARHTVRVGDTEIPAGKKVVLLLGAANRDGSRWADPAAFQIGRPKAMEHVAFGRGAHTCIGAPLARVEVRIMLEQLLEQTSAIEIDDDQHGPAGDRRFDYEPSYIIRGLNELYLRLRAA